MHKFQTQVFVLFFTTSIFTIFAAMASGQGVRLTSDGADAIDPHAAHQHTEATPATADCCAVSNGAHDSHSGHASHGSHGPIGVMAEHPHPAGEVMLSYRYMTMHMDGSRDGTHRLSDADVRARGYGVVPTEMDMQMHMFGAMWAPADDVTLMAMLPYVRNSMKHKTGMTLGDVRFKTTSEGLGDLQLGSLITLYDEGPHTFLGTVGLSLPTGSISEKDNTPMGQARLPYPMQLGSGTFDFIPRLGYTYQASDWSWGNQVTGVIRIEENRFDYALGDRFEATSWFTFNHSDASSSSVRMNYQAWGDIRGRDSSLGSMAPTMDPGKRAGERLDVLLGVSHTFHEGVLEGHRIAIEGGVPLYQRLDGPQLETDWILTAGWQWIF